MEYTLEEIRAIVRELIKYDSEMTDLLCNSDMEDGKEYGFDSGVAWAKLTAFAADCDEDEDGFVPDGFVEDEDEE